MRIIIKIYVYDVRNEIEKVTEKGSRGRPHAAALSVGVFDAADVTYLTAIILKHENS